MNFFFGIVFVSLVRKSRNWSKWYIGSTRFQRLKWPLISFRVFLGHFLGDQAVHCHRPIDVLHLMHVLIAVSLILQIIRSKFHCGLWVLIYDFFLSVLLGILKFTLVQFGGESRYWFQQRDFLGC